MASTTVKILATTLLVLVLTSWAYAGYWERQGGGVVTDRPTDQKFPSGTALKVDDASQNVYSATLISGNWGTTKAVMKWSDPPKIIIPGQVVPVSAQSACQSTGNPYNPSLTIAIDMPGMNAYSATGSIIRLLTISGTTSATNRSVKSDLTGSGDRCVYVRAGWGEGSMLQVAYKYIWKEGTPPASVSTTTTSGTSTQGTSTGSTATGNTAQTAGASNAPSQKVAEQAMAMEMGAPETNTIFYNGNLGGVSNGGRPPSFTINRAAQIHFLWTYHYNSGRGTNAGTLALKSSTGQVYGPWKVACVRTVYWVTIPNVTIPPGRYTVIDSDSSTWSQNSESGGNGHTMVKGTYK
ncbi:MAG: hypothetical protein RDV48_00970 [Candidatus Eremiobacteraeota bacterium]|nr:hypothetical protein [Candidatus Eremiobacteraeota bacterium]